MRLILSIIAAAILFAQIADVHAQGSPDNPAAQSAEDPGVPIAPQMFNKAEYARKAVILRASRPGRDPSFDDFALGTVTMKPLRGADLYTALDRPDLVTAYKTRRGVRVALLVTGSVLATAGTLFGGAMTLAGALGVGSGGGNVPLQFELSGIAVLLSAGVGGFAMLITGAALPDHPIPIDEAADIARQRDAELRRQYGLPPAIETRRTEPQSRLLVVPVLGQTFVGASVLLTF